MAKCKKNWRVVKNPGFNRPSEFFLWTLAMPSFTGQPLEYSVPVRGSVVALFDPKRYVPGPAVRNSRWRIDFNGLGSVRYCATVERTPELDALLSLDILGRAKAFMATLPTEMIDHAINWVYLPTGASSLHQANLFQNLTNFHLKCHIDS